MADATVITVFLLLFFAIGAQSGDDKRRVIEAEGSPDDLVWVVQLSDLHFSVHHPQRAQDFMAYVGPALSFIKPSLVLLTGDLTGLFSTLVYYCGFVLMDLVLAIFGTLLRDKDLSFSELWFSRVFCS